MEKKVILEEIAMYQDKPMSQAFDELKKQFFGAHPLGHSILGTTQSISDLTREQMHDYFERRYAPNNLTWVLSGQFDFDAAVSQIEELCGDWKTADAPRAFPIVSSTKGITTIPTDKFARAHIALMGPGFGAQDERRIAAALACEALGAGDASRLYWALVHPGWAEAAQVGHSASDGNGHVHGVVICTPDHAQMALDVFRAEMNRACSDGLTDAEIERARRRMASSMTLGAETPMGRLRPVGFNWMYRRELLSPSDSLERLMEVSPAQVNEVLKTKPFESSSIVSVGPVESLV
jgi:predicted Zn-dependent peptidase